MRTNNSIFINVPSGWYVCGGMIAPKNNNKYNHKYNKD